MKIDLSLYLVTDPYLCGERGVVETVRRAVDGGVTVVQLRDKAASDADTVELLLALSEAIGGRARLVVNDRLDAALTARQRGARVDGVHLGQGDTSAAQAREALGPDALIGLTANTFAHLEAVQALPSGTVDYLGVGVIRPTATKPDHPEPLGIDGFAAFAARSTLPCVAIGGVGIDDTEALHAAGAAGLAVVSALCTAADPSSEAAHFRRRWRSCTTPRVLSIAGSDPSGGAGVQADLKSIAAHGGYGMAAITALTAQNTRGVRAVHVPPAQFLREQLDALSDDIIVDAVKIGMLADRDVIGVVTAWLSAQRPPIVVLDPVMVATSGDRLLAPAAEGAMRDLLPLVTVVTPNLAELAVLTGRRITDWTSAVDAAYALSDETGTVVLVTGGDLDGDEAPDALVHARHGIRREFHGTRVPTTNTHGTGCSFSSAIATRLARGEDLESAVLSTKAWLRESLRASDALAVGGGHGPISHLAGLWARGGIDPRPSPNETMTQWWEGIAATRDRIDDLPFIRGLADGSLDRDAFLFYLAQDAMYLREYSRVLAEASRIAPSPEEQAFWAESAHNSIVEELTLHESWLGGGAAAAHAPAARLQAEATTAYVDHLRSVAFGGDYTELVAALLPCFWLYSDLGARLLAGDFGAQTLDPGHPYASWLATYGNPAFRDVTQKAVGFVGAAVARQDSQGRARARRAFNISSAHELAFFAAPGA